MQNVQGTISDLGKHINVKNLAYTAGGVLLLTAIGADPLTFLLLLMAVGVGYIFVQQMKDSYVPAQHN